MAAEQQGNAQAQAQAQTAIQQLLSNFHQATQPRLADQHNLDAHTILNALAAHGILGSGETGYREGLATKSYGQQLYDAQLALLQQISGAQSGAISTATGLHQGVVSAIQTAYQNFINNPGLYTGVDPNAAVVATTPSVNAPAAQPTAPTAAPVPKHRQVAHALVNPYTTGQKLYG